MTAMLVAGEDVPDPLGRLLGYIIAHAPTVRRFDLALGGDPYVLTRQEVIRTRVVNSRISNIEVDWFVETSAQAGSLWQAVSPSAILADADPTIVGGLYDDALALFDHFATRRRSGVSTGKISKVLHLKRPGLFPILDSQLRRMYRHQARAAAPHHSRTRPAVRRAYWVAVRADVIAPANAQGLSDIRAQVSQSGNSLARRAAELSDVRLLDMLTWQRPPGKSGTGDATASVKA